MLFIDQFALAQDATFVMRVQMALVKSAIAVSAEDTTTPYHTERATWSAQVLRDSAHYAKFVAYGVASSVAITADSTDNDIEFTINSQWNAYAGAIKAQEVQTIIITE